MSNRFFPPLNTIQPPDSSFTQVFLKGPFISCTCRFVPIVSPEIERSPVQNVPEAATVQPSTPVLSSCFLFFNYFDAVCLEIAREEDGGCRNTTRIGHSFSDKPFSNLHRRAVRHPNE